MITLALIFLCRHQRRTSTVKPPLKKYVFVQCPFGAAEPERNSCQYPGYCSSSMSRVVGPLTLYFSPYRTRHSFCCWFPAQENFVRLTDHVHCIDNQKLWQSPHVIRIIVCSIMRFCTLEHVLRANKICVSNSVICTAVFLKKTIRSTKLSVFIKVTCKKQPPLKDGRFS